MAILFLDPQFSIDLQLIGGVIILQTLPAVALGLYTRWFHRWALIAGWAAGMARRLLDDVYKIQQKRSTRTARSDRKEHFGGSGFPLSELGFDTTSVDLRRLPGAARATSSCASIVTLHPPGDEGARGRGPHHSRTSTSPTPATRGCSDIPRGRALTAPTSYSPGAWLRDTVVTIAVAVARAHGVETMFTLSGAHVFPMYDGAVKAEPPMRLRRRAARADRGVRRRGDRQADPHARARGAHGRARA